MKKTITAGKTEESAKGRSRAKSNKQEPHAVGPVGSSSGIPELTIGVDLGDRTSHYCAMSAAGEVLFERSAPTTKKGITAVFEALAGCRVVMEVGTHSPWVSRLVASYGHEVLVANPRQLKLISQSSRKNDRVDAQMLARLGRVDPELLRPIRHRSETAQRDLLKVKVRATLVEARTQMINAVRGMAKSNGERLPACASEVMGVAKAESLPEELKGAFKPLLEEVEALTARIRQMDKEIEQMADERYPASKRLRQIQGVGTLTAMTFMLTVEEPGRFKKSREVGCLLGLRPRQSQSGERQPQLPITKEGDGYMRKLLVQGAHYILGPRGRDSDLRRWGLAIAARGGANGKKRAVVAVARKLAVLMHRLWVSGENYDGLRNSRASGASQAA